MVDLTDYRHEWDSLFINLKDEILRIDNDLVKDIQHIGSTSVGTLKAKDIIDIQIAINSFEDIEGIKLLLDNFGFKYIDSILQDHVPFQEFDYFEEGWGKRFFMGCYKGQQFNIHVRCLNSLNWEFALNFKKYMKRNKHGRFAFMQFKERLAKSGVSKEDYCLIKDSVIDLISLQFDSEN